MTERRDRADGDELRRFLAGRAPAAAPRGLADEILAAAARTPQVRRPVDWPLPSFATSRRSTALAMTVLLALALLVALMALLAVGRTRPVGDGRWERTTIGTPTDEASAQVVAATPLGLFATVRDGVGADLADHVWRSLDGRTWHAVADDGAFAQAFVRGFLPTPAGSGAGSARVLAFGSRLDGTSGRVLATWRTDDGEHWTLLASGSTDPLPGQEEEEISAIALAAPGVAAGGAPAYVAVGSVRGQAFGGAAAWHSQDGVTWVRSRSGAALEAHGVARLADGSYATIWREPTGTYAWTSRDGTTWTRGAVINADTCCGPVALIALGGGSGGLVAVGTHSEDGADAASAWTSRDARTWTRTELPTPPGHACRASEEMPSCPITAFAVTADALRVVIVGTESSGMGAGSHGAIWASADGGGAWLAEPISDEFALHPTFGDRGDYGLFGVAAGGPTTFVVVGRTAAAGPTAWLGHPFPADDRGVPPTGP